MSKIFKPGDKVIRTGSVTENDRKTHGIEQGETYTVKKCSKEGLFISLEEVMSTWDKHLFALAPVKGKVKQKNSKTSRRKEEQAKRRLWTFETSCLDAIDWKMVYQEAVSRDNPVAAVYFKDSPNVCVVIVHQSIIDKAYHIEDELEVDPWAWVHERKAEDVQKYWTEPARIWKLLNQLNVYTGNHFTEENIMQSSMIPRVVKIVREIIQSPYKKRKERDLEVEVRRIEV